MPVKIVIPNYQSLEQGEEMNLFVVEEKKGVGEEMEGRKERKNRERERGLCALPDQALTARHTNLEQNSEHEINK